MTEATTTLTRAAVMAARQYKLSTNIPTVRLSNSRPFITQKAVLNSLHAQQIFERGYDMCANGLFSLTVVLRFIGTEEQALAVETMGLLKHTRPMALFCPQVMRLQP